MTKYDPNAFVEELFANTDSSSLITLIFYRTVRETLTNQDQKKNPDNGGTN